MTDPRLNPHSMREAAYILLKALKEGRLVAYDGEDGDPLPVEYWKDKTTDALDLGRVRMKSEDVMRVFPAPAKGEKA